MIAAGPSTVSQIAGWLSMRPDRLYYHLAALVEAGLLVERSRVRTGKRFGAVYDVAAFPPPTKGSTASRKVPAVAPAGATLPQTQPELIVRVVRSALRLAERDFKRVISDPETVLIGPKRTVWGGRVKGWIDEDQLVAFNALMDQALSMLRHGAPRAGAHARSFTFVVAPVTRGTARDRTKSRSRKESE